MTQLNFARWTSAGFGLAAWLASGWTAAEAQAAGTASAWTTQKYGPMRLVSGLPRAPGVTPVAGKLYAGIHIKLDPGWKTYWRQPGDSGVPPRFDWAGSVNAADVRVLYPVPVRMPEAGMISLGYKREVVLPVEITPKEAGKPVELKLAAEYGVCKDICIPAEATLTLALPEAGGPGEGALIGSYLARVPRQSGAGAPSLQGFTSELTGTAPRLVLDAVFPQGSDGADALIEVSGGELAPLPVIAARTGNDRVRFEARFASAAEARKFAGQALVVTLISTAAQSEVAARVP